MFSNRLTRTRSNPTTSARLIFQKGDSIEITFVERTSENMTVKGHYNLVSHDKASLALNITTTNDIAVPRDPRQQMQIFKGHGDFELVRSHWFLVCRM